MGVRELLQRWGERPSVTPRDTCDTGRVTEKSLANQGCDIRDTCDTANGSDTQRSAANAGPEWEPADVAEAAEERAAIVEESTGATAEDVARTAKRFYDHVFGPARGTGCCRAAFGVYCDEGARLKREYEAAVAACDATLPERAAARARVKQGDR